jgi:hypothetical protein
MAYQDSDRGGAKNVVSDLSERHLGHLGHSLGSNPGSERLFCVSNGSVTPREEGFVKQTQVMLLGGWLSNDAASRLIEIDVKMEPWLRRYS